MRKRAGNQNPSASPQPEWQPNEWYESLLKMKRDHPRLYQRSISANTQQCVDLYAAQKEYAARKAA